MRLSLRNNIALTRRIAAGGPAGPPANSVAPTMSGDGIIAQWRTIDVSNNGTWSNSPTGYTYQLYRGGVAVSGWDTSQSFYQPVDTDSGVALRFGVTAVNNAGSSSEVLSNQVTAAFPNLASDTPTLTRTSASGAAPFTYSTAFGSQTFAGYRAHYTFASDAAFTTILWAGYVVLSSGMIAGTSTIDLAANGVPDVGYSAFSQSGWPAQVYARAYVYTLTPVGTVYTSPTSAAITKTDAAWTPASLYAVPGTNGDYFEFGDLTTLFQDTAATSPVTTAGQSIARVNGKRGSLNLTQATAANRPLYQVATGKGYGDFDGSNDYLVSGSYPDSQPLYVAAAIRFDAAVNGTFYTICDGNGGSERMSLAMDVNAGVNYLRIYAGAGILDWGVYGVVGEDAAVSADFNGASSAVRKDNVAGATQNGGTNNVASITIGAAFNFSGPLDGRIYALIFMDRIPDASERAEIQTWLDGKMP